MGNFRITYNMGLHGKMKKIPNEKLAALYIKMICRLNKEYIRGFFIWVSIFQKNLDMDINKADDAVNTLWQECVDGKATLMKFIGAIKEYERIILKGYAVYKYKNRGKK